MKKSSIFVWFVVISVSFVAAGINVDYRSPATSSGGGSSTATTLKNVSFLIGGGTTGVVGVTTVNYMYPYGFETFSTAFSQRSMYTPKKLYLKNLYVRKSSGAVTANYSVYVDGVMTNLRCITPAVAATFCQDNTTIITVPANSNFSVGQQKPGATNVGVVQFTIEAMYELNISSGQTITNETIQDVIGNILGNTSDITLQYFDGVPRINATLRTTGVSAGIYGGSSQGASVSIDSKGRVRSAQNVSLNMTDLFTMTWSATSISGDQILNLDDFPCSATVCWRPSRNGKLESMMADYVVTGVSSSGYLAFVVRKNTTVLINSSVFIGITGTFQIINKSLSATFGNADNINVVVDSKSGLQTIKQVAVVGEFRYT